MKEACQAEVLSTDVTTQLSRLRAAYEELVRVHIQAEKTEGEAINQASLYLAGRLLDELEALVIAGAPASRVILEIDRFTVTLDLAASELLKEAKH